LRKYFLRVAWNLRDNSENIEVTPSLLAKSLLFYVQAIGYFHAKPEYYTERKDYNSYLLVYTREGEGSLHYRGHTYQILPGQAFLLNCKEYHYYETHPQKLWGLQWIHFNGEACQSYYEHIIKQGNPVMTLRESSIIPASLDRLLELYRSRSAHSDIMSAKLIADLLTELLLQSETCEIKDIPQFVMQALNELERNCARKIKLDDLARDLNVSKFHLAREFRKHIGFSVSEYLIFLRLSMAKEMLKYTDLSVEEIALQAGFHQSSHLIRFFRRQEDTTPLAFRKEWRNKS
jgi:AraC-like DNA-binding protein